MDVLSILGFILAVGLVMFGMTFDQESMRIVYHNLKAFLDIPSMATVSYTHLDVYKRQVYESNRDLVSIGAYKKGTNPELDDALERNDRIYGFLQQKTDESFSLDESVIQMIQATD